MKLSIIAAVAKNGIIGKNGELPWHLGSDLRRFRKLTIGKTVITGRRTHESIIRRLGRPLDDRRTIVVTRQNNYESECEVAHSLEEAIQRARNDDEVFVIGGAELYKEALIVGDRLYLTEVDTTSPGDTFFPWENKVLWRETAREEYSSDENNEYATRFLTFERKVLALSSYINMENARQEDQRIVMEHIKETGICPFCPENRVSGEVLDPVWTGKHWMFVPNRWPYEFTRVHLMGIAERHVRFIHELTDDEWLEVRMFIDWAIKQYNIESGALGIRFGNPVTNGATVDHLHIHLVVADPDVTRPGYERVRFAMGPKPPQK